ncbi:Kef-type K+ transport system membrane component KefB [Kitasatospora sp. GP30]|uniref:cation:proton antiporter n=1 Tax=Kitasatospora sp. GP30 TaxID=3035084 RepID=UPI000CABBFE9|nr:cation:proton antiporter [Kitasatospora sp. GP30]MDH6139928.1 Kef-type K+ transport system membrane component KefB [Kitasatospora sp. GP30]
MRGSNSPDRRPGTGRAPTLLAHLALVAVTAAAIALLLHAIGGDGGPRAPGGAAKSTSVFGTFLVAMPLILLCAQLAGRCCRRLGQPAVIGEILAGILLGPSLLGRLSPGTERWLFTAHLAPVLDTLSQLGLVAFMFLIGYELDLGRLRRHRSSAVLISHAGIALPALAGILLAVPMYTRFAEPGVGFPVFALFIGVAMSVTAFPVLARVLTDRGLDRTPLGALALASAAVGDVIAWCLLALVTALAGHHGPARVLVTIGLSGAFFLVMRYGVRPLLLRVGRADASRTVPVAAVLPLLLGGVLLSSYATDRIGVHPIFGAFLFGAVMPRNLPPVNAAVEHLRGVAGLLLPLFFVSAGLNIRLDLLGSDPTRWAWCLLITAVAMLAKWGASSAAARVGGIEWPQALSLGALMNCRGLTELVILSIGYQLGVISSLVYSLLVVMTLISTAVTAPALSGIARVFAGRRPAPVPPPERATVSSTSGTAI